MKTQFEMVQHFNSQVLGISSRPVGLTPPSEFALSLFQLREEINEMELAYDEGNLVSLVDGMIDLHFFLLGVVYKHGITEEVYHEMFTEVYQANMEKKLGVKSTRQGFDAADAVKPDGWVPPEDRLEAILNRVVR